LRIRNVKLGEEEGRGRKEGEGRITKHLAYFFFWAGLNADPEREIRSRLSVRTFTNLSCSSR